MSHSSELQWYQLGQAGDQQTKHSEQTGTAILKLQGKWPESVSSGAKTLETK